MTLSEQMTGRYAREVALAIEAAQEAGALLRAELHRPGGPRGAADHAEVDEEAERVIRDRLLASTPFGYRGEELAKHGRAKDGHVWVVDPNDGTRQFLRGQRGSAVSIALLRDGLPVLGVVHAFAYPDNSGDLLAWAEGGPVLRNGVPIASTLGGRTLASGEVVLVSHGADAGSEANAACAAPARFRTLPSIAYRLALVAAGEAVCGVSLNHPCGWDYAAGHALLLGAGDVLLDERGRPVTYDVDGGSQVRWCFGGAPQAAKLLAGRPWQEALRGGEASPLVRTAPGRLVAGAARLDRAQGCLGGQLAGDALGALVEFKSARDIGRLHPDGLRLLADGGTWNTLAGQPTDDSELALALARSIVSAGGFEASAARAAYQAWFRSGPFDVGGTTSAALGASTTMPLDAYLAHVAQACGKSKANGSVMRACALGILGAGRPDAAAAWAREDSALTHPNPVCQAASAAFVAAICVAIDTGSAREALAAARNAAAGEPEVLTALDAAEHGAPGDFQTHMGFVLIALQNAFHQALHAPSLEEGLVDTVMRGGDTDTNAAIAGALLGAIHGRSALPAQWVQVLLSCRPLASAGAHRPRPKTYWPVDFLELAEVLLALSRR